MYDIYIERLVFLVWVFKLFTIGGQTNGWMDGQCVLLATRPPHGCLWHESFDVARNCVVVYMLLLLLLLVSPMLLQLFALHL